MATLISTIMRVAICLEKLNDFNENEGSFIIYQWNFEKYKNGIVNVLSFIIYQEKLF